MWGHSAVGDAHWRAADIITVLSVISLVQLSLPDTMHIVRGFDNVFVAAQLHFHWGTVKVPGSEHTVDGLHFPAEVWLT